MLHLIIILALLPMAVGTVIWIALGLWAALVWIFLAPFRFAGWLVSAVKAVI